MAVIAKVSIGQFAPGDALSGIDDARVNELIEAGHAEDIGLTDDEKAEQKRAEAERKAAEKARLEAESKAKAEAEAEQKRLADEAAKQDADKAAKSKPADSKE